MTDFQSLQTKELEKARKASNPLSAQDEAGDVLCEAFEDFEDFWDGTTMAARRLGRNVENHDEKMFKQLVLVAAVCQRAAEDLKRLAELTAPETKE